MYCSFLGEQEKATTDKTIMNDTYNDRLFTQNTSCFDDNTDKKNVDIESKLRMEGYNSKLECSKMIERFLHPYMIIAQIRLFG